MYTLSLEIINKCNLNCTYCYLGEKKNTYMSLETAQKAIDIAVHEANKQHDRTLMVYFIGGEPLMAFNLMKDVVDYAKKKCQETNLICKFSTTINGTLVTDEVIDFFVENTFEVKVSLDGPEYVQNLNRRDYKKEIEDALIAGRMPENSREILVKSGYEDFGEEVKVGMQFEISLGREKIPVTVSGIFQSTKVASTKGSGQLGFNAAMMCMTEDAFKELLPGINNFDFTWVINIDPREESSVDENLRNTISQNEDIAIESFSERVNRYEKNNTIYLILQMISSLIFLFGVINLINTTLSNQLFRRREYSVLRSIGLTEKQLYKVIIGEGMCYSILSICMTLLIGTPIAMLICRQMSISCYGKVVEYSFPFFYMGIYVLVLLLIQVILSIYQIREQKKKSIIDQLRME